MSDPHTAALCDALAKALGYLETWRQDQGYGGIVVHSCWSTTDLHYVGWHSYTNASMALGFLRLYQRFGREERLRRSLGCADVLVSLQKPDGMFRNSTGEHDPEEGILIHNAMPDVALLQIAQVLHTHGLAGEDARRYIHAAGRNIDWIVRGWWNERRFCGTINQDLYACLAMALWQRLCASDRYSDYIAKTLDYVRGMAQTEGVAAGAIQRSEDPDGKVFATPYQTLKALLLLQLGQALGDRGLEEMGAGAARFVGKLQQEDGRFAWGYQEDQGALVLKRLPYVNSISYLECAKAYEPMGVSMNWRAFLPWLLRDIPMRLASGGFAGSEEPDWRNSIPSPDNCGLISGLVSALPPSVEQEPEAIPFSGPIVAAGRDVMAGGEYLYLENASGVFRIRADGNPGLDYVLSKKAEYPSAFPRRERASFGVFKAMDRAKWRLAELDEKQGRAVYREDSSGSVREFSLGPTSLRVRESPYAGMALSFEAPARTSLSHRLEMLKDGKLLKIDFARLDGRDRTVVEGGLGNSAYLASWSPRLRAGNVTLSFKRAIRRLVVEHGPATAFGSLTFTLELDPCRQLEMEVSPGYTGKDRP